MTAVLLLAAALAVWPPPGAVPRLRADGRPRRLSGTTGRLAQPAVAAAVTLVVALLSTALVAVLAGGCAALATRAELRRRARLRTEAGLHELTEALGVLTADLRSGRTPVAAAAAAIGVCGQEGARRALARALRAPGSPAPAGRTAEPAEAFDRIAAAVLLSERTGCSLAAVLAAVEDDLRERLRHGRELRAAVAAPRASALLLSALPLLGLAMGSGIGAGPWRVLTTTSVGQVLLVAGVGLELAGIAWTARLVARVAART